MESLEKKESPESEAFEKEFQEDSKNPDFDKKAFWEIIAWKAYDPNLSKEENFQNAFNSQTNKLFTTHLSNLPEEKRQELQNLQKGEHGGKSPQELIAAYSEITQALSNRTAESTKSWLDAAQQKNQQESNKTQTEKQNFIDQLKKAWQESYDKNEENKKLIYMNRQASLEEQKWAESIMDGFPIPSQSPKESQTA